MPGNLILPNEVVRDIKRHVEAAVRRAERGYSSAMEEEDTITGELGGALRTNRERVVRVTDWQPPGTWRWKIGYSKFRSKAKNATESIVGADGIIEIRVRSPKGEQLKSALFQAKNTAKSDPNLIEQCAKMSVWREASFVIIYSSVGYKAYSLDEVFLARGSLSVAKDGDPVANWITDTFIGCLVGHPGLYYKREERRLYWMRQTAFENVPEEERWVWVDFSPKHLIHIDVKAPEWREIHAEQITKTNVSQNRLAFTPEDLFGFRGPFTFEQLKKRRAELLNAYHSDHSYHLGPLERANLDKRVIEINDAYSRLRQHVVPQMKTSKRTRAEKPKSSPGLQEPKLSVDDVLKEVQKGKRVKVRTKRSG